MEFISYQSLCLVIFWISNVTMAFFLIGCLPFYIYKRVKAENMKDAYHYQNLILTAMIIILVSLLLSLFTATVNLD